MDNSGCGCMDNISSLVSDPYVTDGWDVCTDQTGPDKEPELDKRFFIA